MLFIKTNIGNFSRPKDLLLEMKSLGIIEVETETSYFFSDALKLKMTLEDVEKWVFGFGN